MSLLSSRVGFKHYTSIYRDVNAGQTDAGGQTVPPDWELIGVDVLCRAWTDSAREPTDAGKIIVIEDRQAAVSVDTDVTEADQLGDITDKAGNLIFQGPMNIRGVLRYPEHLELSLLEVR